ncbi:MAG: GNAT family N-acetyltransferase [Phycisphaerales bacterium]|nr:GNAT family N-acetyltransferase [Phycisphaerales bacterium]
MHCRTLMHTDTTQAEEVRRLFFEAYTVEAALIGVADFPPLRRSASDIARAPSIFFGCERDQELAAVAEVETTNGPTANIAAFAVRPAWFRHGMGTFLLAHLLALLDKTTVTVSTACGNIPALALYEKFGFRSSRHWRTACGIDMVTLAREP